MTDLKVSVIIPVYNQREFIHETIDSVLAQTYRNMEIIVADDGSTDGTVAIIQEYGVKHPDRIIPVYSEKNTGIAANMNRGLRRHTGEFIAWLGGDDLMLPGKIREQVELLERRPDAAGCCHDAVVFNSETGKTLGLFSELYNGKKGFREGGVELWFRSGYKMLPSTMMIRSSACPSHGFDERLVFANDWLFDIEVFRQGTCAVINEPLAKYRRHERNITVNPKTKARALEETLIVLGIVDARYPELHSFVKRRRLAAFLKEAVKSYAQGDMLRFRDYLAVLARERAWMRAFAVYFGCRLFGSLLKKMILRESYDMPRWLVRSLNFLRGK
jgi:glycosyltransferase involved in cell wall biosynthesis